MAAAVWEFACTCAWKCIIEYWISLICENIWVLFGDWFNMLYCLWDLLKQRLEEKVACPLTRHIFTHRLVRNWRVKCTRVPWSSKRTNRAAPDIFATWFLIWDPTIYTILILQAAEASTSSALGVFLGCCCVHVWQKDSKAACVVLPLGIVASTWLWMVHRGGWQRPGFMLAWWKTWKLFKRSATLQTCCATLQLIGKAPLPIPCSA